MENKKEDCENLLEKYRDLQAKTALKPFDLNKSGGKIIESQYIPIEYFKEFDKVRKEIKACFNYFSDDILVELFVDFDFRLEINKILMERVRNRNLK